jgi:hypothetical protein
MASFFDITDPSVLSILVADIMNSVARTGYMIIQDDQGDLAIDLKRLEEIIYRKHYDFYHLIRRENRMFYVMTPDQYSHLLATAEENHKDVGAIVKTDAMNGTIDTHDVKLSYFYDGGKLNYNIIEKHTLASRLASDQFIMQHVSHIIQQVLNTPAAPPVHDTEVVHVNPPTETKVEGAS